MKDPLKEATEILSLYKEWNHRVQTDFDSNENFQKRIEILSEAKKRTEKFLKENKNESSS